MRIKIGSQWFDVGHMQPIMVELTEEDKRNIANMPPDQNRYAQFSNTDLTTDQTRLAWMQDRENG